MPRANENKFGHVMAGMSTEQMSKLVNFGELINLPFQFA